MILGPPRILACPHCGAFASETTWISGNTCGAFHFTDAYMIALHMPRVQALARCKGCSRLFWLDDAEVVWEPYRDMPPVDDEVRQCASHVGEPTEDDLAEALAIGLGAGREREHYLRVQLWWAGNHRSPEAPATAETAPRWRHNLEALAALLDESDGAQRLMKAEAARELGRFDEARRLLDFLFDRGARHHVAAISRLVEQNRTEVELVRGDEGLAEEERREIAQKQQRREDEERERKARREAERETFLSPRKAALARGSITEAERCPKCGFSYAWDGVDCRHCHHHVAR